MSKFNKFFSLPFIPYRIVVELAKNDNFFKLLKYNTYDALNRDDLTEDEKLSLVCKDFDDMHNYNVFLTNVEPNELVDSKTILKIYRYDTLPDNPILSTVCYRFDILYGTKNALVDYQGVPCARVDVMEMELMKTLNGADVAGVGTLQFNHELSRLCRSTLNIGNNYTFTGTSIIMATQIADVQGDNTCGM